MEKKPIKRNKHIVQLSKDHHFTLLFCWKIRTGVKLNVDMERIKKYVQYFWGNHIQPHFNEEETILFAPVKDAAVQKALDEHAEIKKQIDKGDMPLSSYTIIHRDARLTDAEKNTIITWRENIRKDMEAKYPKDSLIRKRKPAPAGAG